MPSCFTLYLSCRLQLMEASCFWFVGWLHWVVTDSWIFILKPKEMWEVREAETGSKMPLALAVFPNMHINLKQSFSKMFKCIPWYWPSAAALQNVIDGSSCCLLCHVEVTESEWAWKATLTIMVKLTWKYCRGWM